MAGRYERLAVSDVRQVVDERCGAQKHRNDHDVVERWCVADGSQAMTGVEHRADEGDTAVEGHLGSEEAKQLRGHLPLGGEIGLMASDGVEVDDLRGQDDEHDGGDDESDHRQGQRGGDVLPGLSLTGAGGQAFHEDWQHGGRQQSPHHQVVDDVRRGVGQVVRVGQMGETERVAERGQLG